MDKAALTKKLADRARLDEAQAAKFVDAFSDVLAEYFQSGEKVVIAEFGSFFVREDKTVQFNPSAKLKDIVG